MSSITRYRVWPDGTVQEADTPAHHWKSDDYELVEAPAPEDAWARAKANAPAVPRGEPLTSQEQQKEWADYFNRCDSYDLPDRRHAFLAGLSRGLKIAATARAPAPSKGAVGFGARALAAELAEAALKDDNDPEGHDISAGLFGPNVSAWLRKVASEYLAPAHAPAQEQCNACLGTGRMVRDPDIGTDQECFVCDGSGYEPAQEVGLTDELEQLGHIANGIRICGVHDKRFVAQRIDDIIAALRAKGGK